MLKPDRDADLQADGMFEGLLSGLGELARQLDQATGGGLSAAGPRRTNRGGSAATGRRPAPAVVPESGRGSARQGQAAGAGAQPDSGRPGPTNLSRQSPARYGRPDSARGGRDAGPSLFPSLMPSQPPVMQRGLDGNMSAVDIPVIDGVFIHSQRGPLGDGTAASASASATDPYGSGNAGRLQRPAATQRGGSTALNLSGIEVARSMDSFNSLPAAATGGLPARRLLPPSLARLLDRAAAGPTSGNTPLPGQQGAGGRDVNYDNDDMPSLDSDASCSNSSDAGNSSGSEMPELTDLDSDYSDSDSGSDGPPSLASCNSSSYSDSSADTPYFSSGSNGEIPQSFQSICDSEEMPGLISEGSETSSEPEAQPQPPQALSRLADAPPASSGSPQDDCSSAVQLAAGAALEAVHARVQRRISGSSAATTSPGIRAPLPGFAAPPAAMPASQRGSRGVLSCAFGFIRHLVGRASSWAGGTSGPAMHASAAQGVRSFILSDLSEQLPLGDHLEADATSGLALHERRSGLGSPEVPGSQGQAGQVQSESERARGTQKSAGEARPVETVASRDLNGTTAAAAGTCQLGISAGRGSKGKGGSDMEGDSVGPGASNAAVAAPSVHGSSASSSSAVAESSTALSAEAPSSPNASASQGAAFCNKRRKISTSESIVVGRARRHNREAAKSDAQSSASVPKTSGPQPSGAPSNSGTAGSEAPIRGRMPVVKVTATRRPDAQPDSSALSGRSVATGRAQSVAAPANAVPAPADASAGAPALRRGFFGAPSPAQQAGSSSSRQGARESGGGSALFKQGFLVQSGRPAPPSASGRQNLVSSSSGNGPSSASQGSYQDREPTGAAVPNAAQSCSPAGRPPPRTDARSGPSGFSGFSMPQPVFDKAVTMAVGMMGAMDVLPVLAAPAPSGLGRGLGLPPRRQRGSAPAGASEGSSSSAELCPAQASPGTPQPTAASGPSTSKAAGPAAAAGSAEACNATGTAYGGAERSTGTMLGVADAGTCQPLSEPTATTAATAAAAKPPASAGQPSAGPLSAAPPAACPPTSTSTSGSSNRNADGVVANSTALSLSAIEVNPVLDEAAASSAMPPSAIPPARSAALSAAERRQSMEESLPELSDGVDSDDESDDEYTTSQDGTSECDCPMCRAMCDGCGWVDTEGAAAEPEA